MGRAVATVAAGVLLAVAGCASPSPEGRIAGLMCETLADHLEQVEGPGVADGDVLGRMELLETEAAFDGANPARVRRLFADRCPATIAAWNDYDAEMLEAACDLGVVLEEAIGGSYEELGLDPMDTSVCDGVPGPSPSPVLEPEPSPEPTADQVAVCAEQVRQVGVVLVQAVRASADGDGDGDGVLAAVDGYDGPPWQQVFGRCPTMAAGTVSLHLGQVQPGQLDVPGFRPIVEGACAAADAAGMQLQPAAQQTCDSL